MAFPRFPISGTVGGQPVRNSGVKLIIKHLHCWEGAAFVRKHCIKLMILRAKDLDSVVLLNCKAGQHPPSTEGTVDAATITKLGPQTIFCVAEVATQIELIPQEIFLCNRLAIARLFCTHKTTHYITQIDSPEYLLVDMYLMDYISQIHFLGKLNCVCNYFWCCR